jgi:uncharacterized DUF497 family protein
VPDLPFTWDPKKARQNLAKHRVSFEEASTVFYDEQGLEMEDPDEASGEDRFVIIGLSANMRLLAVCHCVREVGKVIRIISARRAVKAEQNQYRERLIR